MTEVGVRRVFVVTGSREYPDRGQVDRTLRETLLVGDVVLVGDARGVDRWATVTARTMGCDVRVMPADWGRFGRAAGHIRNVVMLERLCRARELGWETGVLAFWDGSSPGTYDCMTQALERDLVVYQLAPRSQAA